MSLQINQLSISVDRKKIVDDFSLTIANGEIWSVMGPSGCGKSTLLNVICGALPMGKYGAFDIQGEVFLHGTAIHQLAIEKRRVGLLFQDDLLFPHMNVEQNLMFAIPGHYRSSEKKQLVQQALAEAELSGTESMDVAHLSGGQRARISLMRTLLAEPKAILLDEPFSKLDTQLRNSFRETVFKIISARNIPALQVTHDLSDVADGKHLLTL